MPATSSNVTPMSSWAYSLPRLRPKAIGEPAPPIRRIMNDKQHHQQAGHHQHRHPLHERAGHVGIVPAADIVVAEKLHKVLFFVVAIDAEADVFFASVDRGTRRCLLTIVQVWGTPGVELAARDGRRDFVIADANIRQVGAEPIAAPCLQYPNDLQCR